MGQASSGCRGVGRLWGGVGQLSFSGRRGGVLFGRRASWPFWGILAFFGRLVGICVGWVVIRRFVLSFSPSEVYTTDKLQ